MHNVCVRSHSPCRLNFANGASVISLSSIASFLTNVDRGSGSSGCSDCQMQCEFTTLAVRTKKYTEFVHRLARNRILRYEHFWSKRSTAFIVPVYKTPMSGFTKRFTAPVILARRTHAHQLYPTRVDNMWTGLESYHDSAVTATGQSLFHSQSLLLNSLCTRADGRTAYLRLPRSRFRFPFACFACGGNRPRQR